MSHDHPSGTTDLSALVTATESELAAAVTASHVPSLLVTLAEATRNRGLLRSGFRSPPGDGGRTDALPAPQRRLAVELAVEALRELGAAGARPPTDPPDDAELSELVEFVTGPVDKEYLDLVRQELGVPEDAGAPGWTVAEVAPGRRASAVVVGAGMSGLVAAHRLLQAGIDVTVVERNPDVGGVWLDNGYPGARLDTSNSTYTYSFAQRADWSFHYTPRDEVLDYFRSVASRYDLRRHVLFSTTLTAGSFDAARGTWTVSISDATGTRELTADFLVSAVGQLNEPSIPAIPGAEEFRGRAWHTARWEHDHDLAGRRVAVIGTGASAIQVVPPVAEVAEHVTVFQRTPPWVLPTPDYTAPLPAGMRWLLRVVPGYGRWYRFCQFWQNVDGVRWRAVVDPSWTRAGSVSAANEEMRTILTRFLEERFADRPDLLAQVVPAYPPFAKRLVRDDGTWTGALKRPNVTLTSQPIDRISAVGVHTRDGTTHACDVIVYGTGFRASDFLRTMQLRGLDGRTIHEHWQGDAKALNGVAVPNFPNLFLLYGPNTNLNVNGSAVLFSEAAVNHTLECIHAVLAGGHRAIEARRPAYEAYNAALDQQSAMLATGASTVNTWYRNAAGRISQNWPGTTLEYWRRTRAPQPDDYRYL
jgi:4-hydroxyacetophenone monooxygenase